MAMPAAHRKPPRRRDFARSFTVRFAHAVDAVRARRPRRPPYLSVTADYRLTLFVFSP